MRSQFKGSIVAIATAVVVATLWSAARSVEGQSPTTYKALRTADGQPNLNGFWQALNTANWDVEDHGAAPAPHEHLLGAYLAQPAGLSVVEGGTLPYKPESLAQRKLNSETRLNPDPMNRDVSDPEAKCYGPAPPRGTYLPFPFQIIQSKDGIVMAYEFASTPRVIQMGKVDPLVFYGIDAWIGQSKGRWDGDTLVVDVHGFIGKPWLDRAGNFISEKATVVERYTPTSPNHLRYEATITDRDVFTRPWKMSMSLYRRMEPNMQLLEFQCIPLIEEYLYGKYKKPSS